MLIVLLILEIYYWITVGCIKHETREELSEIEGLPDYPNCFNLKTIWNLYEEETMCWTVFGYKKMFD